MEKKKAGVITVEMEEKLWESGILGDHSPQVLVDTVLYLIGLNFALRSGEEHCHLCHFPSQISVVNTEGTIPYIKYCKDISKTHQGGLKSQKWPLNEFFTMQICKIHHIAYCSCF